MFKADYSHFTNNKQQPTFADCRKSKIVNLLCLLGFQPVKNPQKKTATGGTIPLLPFVGARRRQLVCRVRRTRLLALPPSLPVLPFSPDNG